MPSRDSAALEDTKLSSLIPTDIDRTPLVWSSNPAHIEGILHETGLFYKRKGLFQSLLKHGAVLLPNGKTSADLNYSSSLFPENTEEIPSQQSSSRNTN